MEAVIDESSTGLKVISLASAVVTSADRNTKEMGRNGKEMGRNVKQRESSSNMMT